MSDSKKESVAGWELDLGPFAHCARRGQVEVWADHEDLELFGEEGHGYMRQSWRVNLPIEVVARLLEQVGYTVTKRKAACEPVKDP